MTQRAPPTCDGGNGGGLHIPNTFGIWRQQKQTEVAPREEREGDSEDGCMASRFPYLIVIREEIRNTVDDDATRLYQSPAIDNHFARQRTTVCIMVGRGRDEFPFLSFPTVKAVLVKGSYSLGRDSSDLSKRDRKRPHQMRAIQS